MLLLEVCVNSFVKSNFSKEVKETLYLFAVGNSVLNPFIHSFHIFIDVFLGRKKWIISGSRMTNVFKSTTAKEQTTMESSLKHLQGKSRVKLGKQSNVHSNETTN